MKTCPHCHQSYQSARVTYYVKNGTRVFPRDGKTFTVIRCGCDVKVIGQQKSPTEINQ